MQPNAIGPIPALSINAKVGFGHLGGGGTFSCILSTDSPGVLGFGVVPEQQIAQQNFDVGHDGQWTGYNVQFNNVSYPITTMGRVFSNIVGLDGTSFVRMQIA